MYKLIILRRKPGIAEEYDEETIDFVKKEVAREYQNIYNAYPEVTLAYVVDENGNNV